MDRADGERKRVVQKIQALRAICDSVELSLAQTLSGVPCGRNEAQIVVQSAADLAFSLVALDAYVNSESDASGAERWKLLEELSNTDRYPGVTFAAAIEVVESEVREARVKKDASVSPDLFHRAKVSLEDYQGQTNGRITRTLVREVVASMKGGESRAEVKSATDKLIGIFCP